MWSILAGWVLTNISHSELFILFINWNGVEHFVAIFILKWCARSEVTVSFFLCSLLLLLLRLCDFLSF